MKGHVVSIKAYAAVYAALLVLLAATVGVAQFDLGAWNMVAALGIAVSKMVLVMLVFMHLRFSGRLVWLYAGIGFFWLMIMVSLTVADYVTR